MTQSNVLKIIRVQQNKFLNKSIETGINAHDGTVWNRKLNFVYQTYIFLSDIYIYIYMCVCVCVCVCVRRKGKVEEKYVWWLVYLPTRFDFNPYVFFGMQKYFIKIILAWKIIMIDKFWFNWKSLSGLVGLAMWKNGALLVDMLKLSQVMRWHFLEK